MDKKSRIFVAGHNGLVGSAIVRELYKKGYTNLILRSHNELDLTNQKEVEKFFQSEKPEYIFLAAAKVGGILANSLYPAEFYYINSMIQNNVIHNAYRNEVRKLLFLGSSCIYPRCCPQPIKEEYLLSGLLEETNEAYAIAKISGMKMCEYYNREFDTNFISCMPTNLYGPNDNFDLKSSHVIPALISKFHTAKVNSHPYVEIWGSGAPKREFLHVDDMASASIYLMENYNVTNKYGFNYFNIGTGEEVSIKELANTIQNIVGYEGIIKYNTNKPDGTPRKLLDVSRLSEVGWTYSIKLEDGISQTYNWYLDNIDKDTVL